jgi:hypothetical protein
MPIRHSSDKTFESVCRRAERPWSAGEEIGLAHDVSQFRKNGEAILGASTPMVGAVIRPRQRSVIGAGEGVAIGRMTEY